MGANQSSTAGSAGGAQAGQVKTSYYELLGITKQASEDEIKKAYRKKALELHPDRNYGKEEEATRIFAAIQAAYEVLSDPQERAWYDSHEGQILRGDDTPGAREEHYEHNVRITTADDIMRMMSKFHGGIQYTDAPSGFYGFLRETFENLAREEQAAADWEKLDVVDYPSFGHKDDDYDDVVKHFYAVWSSFSTKKTFSWKDRYRLSDAPDRRVRRLMEKENKRFREEAIKEFNDAVRSLVMFVRKRDHRYVPNTQTEDERQKALRDAVAAQRARARAANEEKMRGAIPEWAMQRDAEEAEESEEEESEEEHFECVACSKTFKSERQWEAHEKSKKHQKAVYALKKKMQKDNNNLNLDADVSSSGVATPLSADEIEEDLLDYDEQDQADGELGDIVKPGLVEIANDLTLDEDSAEDAKDLSESTEDSVSLEDEDYASREAIEERLTGEKGLDDQSPPDDASDSRDQGASKIGKAAQKRAKKAAKQAIADQEELKFKCAKCDSAFSSKTRLFQHIKDFGHAAPIQQPTKGGKKGKNKR
ncbi:MAG: hypothetical protein M1820_001569 [Bogoriella megaspora]|nr:MAG: hypothetical protein M1820_001569 [Bogoriella megaspora]